jgi:carboxymethylenebutenolidase
MSDAVLIEPLRSELADRVPALEIRLGGTQRGLVILLSDDTTPEVEVVEAMNTFAGEGFESLALTVGEGIEELAQARARMCGWSPEQIGVVGIGAGATAALEIARRRPLGAVVSLSPAPDVTDVASAPALRTPWLGLFGAEAGDLSASEVARLRRVLDEGSDVFSRVVVYPGVGADFHRRTEDGISFAASYDGWQRTTEWLLARVASRLTPLAQAWRERHPLAD